MAADGFAAHRGTVRGVLLRLVRDPALAEDLTQETLLRATRAAATMRGEASWATWLTAIALNAARDHFRAIKRSPQTALLDQADDIAGEADVEGEILRAEMSACILGHVTRLPDRHRDAVLLHHFGGFSHHDIATILGTSEGNARVLLHRGLAALKTNLDQDCTLDFTDPIPCERR